MREQRPRVRVNLTATRDGIGSPRTQNVGVVPSLITDHRAVSPQSSSHFLAADTVDFSVPPIDLPTLVFTTMFEGDIPFPNIPYQQYPTNAPQPLAAPTPGRIAPAKSVSMRLIVHGMLTELEGDFSHHFTCTPVVSDNNNVSTSNGTMAAGSKYRHFAAHLKVVAYNPTASTIVGATLKLNIIGHLVSGIPALG